MENHISRLFVAAAGVMSVLAGSAFALPGLAHAERSIQVTNDTDTGFWVTSFSRNDAARAITFAGTAFHVMPGESTQLVCGGAEGCDLLLDRAPGASAPSFHGVTDSCIRVTTYNSSRAIAAYSTCIPLRLRRPERRRRDPVSDLGDGGSTLMQARLSATPAGARRAS